MGVDSSSFRDGLGMRLRRAYLSMHRTFNAHFMQHSATADQFVILTLLAEGDGVTQQELVRTACSDPNTITVMLRLLEKRGLVRRTSHDQDGRARCVYITAKGRTLQRKLDSGAEVFHALLRSAVPAGNGKTLLEDLRRIAESMQPPPPRSRRRAAGQETPPAPR
jgi:DNA-binding MarR family transcriptional regulator